VREPVEWNLSNLGEFGARQIPLQELPQRLGEIEADANIIVYCRSGARSEMAARFMLGNGFERVTNLAGGINAWAHDVDPTMRTY
jgi:sulfur-carrier protein adenylyltransferase/sulfurtransferase